MHHGNDLMLGEISGLFDARMLLEISGRRDDYAPHLADPHRDH